SPPGSCSTSAATSSPPPPAGSAKPPDWRPDMSEIDQVLAAIDKFESDLGFTAPELIPMRIGQLREMVRDVFEATGSEDGDDWFEVGDANAGTTPEQLALVELMGHAQVTGSWRETVLCGGPMLEISRLDAAERRVQLVGPESVYRLTPPPPD